MSESPLPTEINGKFVWTPVVLIVVVHLFALLGFWFYSIEAFLFFLGFHFFVGCLGAVIGMHRYFSHKVFETSPTFEAVLGYLAVLNLQGGPISWAMYHRSHHIDTDMPGDPHASSRGFWWSHVVWNFYIAPNGFRRRKHLIRDLTSSPALRFINKHQLSINFVTFAVFALLVRRLDIIIWAFPIRIVFMWHSTWAINSYVHSVFSSKRGARNPIKNSLAVSLILYGEGWHGNHHDDPNSPTTSSSRYQFDPGYWVMRGMQSLGLIRLKRRNIQKKAVSA